MIPLSSAVQCTNVLERANSTSIHCILPVSLALFSWYRCQLPGERHFVNVLQLIHRSKRVLCDCCASPEEKHFNNCSTSIADTRVISWFQVGAATACSHYP